MSLESIYYIGQSISVVVIIATLFAILHQGQQANQIARSELSHDQLLNSHGLLGPTVATNPEYADFLVRVLEENAAMSATDRIRFLNFMHSLVIVFGSAHTLKSKGMIEAQMFADSASAMVWWMQFDRSRGWWKGARKHYSDGVRDAIDEIVANRQVSPVGATP